MNCASPTNETPQVSSLGEILIVNQASRALMFDMVEELQQLGWTCTVLTGPVPPDTRVPPGTTILVGCRLTRDTALKRIWSWGRFTWQTAWTIIRKRRAKVIVVTTPPFAPLFMPLLRRLLRVDYCIFHYDIFPEAMERMGMLTQGGFAANLWRRFSRRSMLRAQGVLTLGESLQRTLQNHFRPHENVQIEVIPTWVDTDFLRPISKAESPFVTKHGLEGRFVVMYSGNFGETHDLASFIEAAEMLRHNANIRFVLIGGGARSAQVEADVQRRNLPNLILLPFQPFDMLPYSMGAADAFVVSLDDAYAGISTPSKVPYALAAGAALLAISPTGTELENLAVKHGCGIHIPPHNANALADAIRKLHDNPGMLEACKRHSRSVAETMYAKKELVPKLGRYVTRIFDGCSRPPGTS